jgi:hypothetical protein
MQLLRPLSLCTFFSAFLFPASAFADEIQSSDPVVSVFAGHWKGSCFNQKSSRHGLSQKVADMERAVSYDGQTKTLIWNSHYHSERFGSSSKNYKLIALDSDRGAYQIDEGGGLKLDTFFTGDALISLFSIAAQQGNPGIQMHSVERVVGDILTIDFTTFPLSGRTSDMAITTFQLQNVQHCELKKQKQ